MKFQIDYCQEAFLNWVSGGLLGDSENVWARLTTQVSHRAFCSISTFYKIELRKVIVSLAMTLLSSQFNADGVEADCFSSVNDRTPGIVAEKEASHSDRYGSRTSREKPIYTGDVCKKTFPMWCARKRTVWRNLFWSIILVPLECPISRCVSVYSKLTYSMGAYVWLWSVVIIHAIKGIFSSHMNRIKTVGIS